MTGRFTNQTVVRLMTKQTFLSWILLLKLLSTYCILKLAFHNKVSTKRQTTPIEYFYIATCMSIYSFIFGKLVGKLQGNEFCLKLKVLARRYYPGPLQGSFCKGWGSQDKNDQFPY